MSLLRLSRAAFVACGVYLVYSVYLVWMAEELARRAGEARRWSRFRAASIASIEELFAEIKEECKIP